MGRGRYLLVELLRSQGVREQHIRATLRSELGLEGEELERALEPEPLEVQPRLRRDAPERKTGRRGVVVRLEPRPRRG